MAPFAKVYNYPGGWRLQRAQILAAINGLEIEEHAGFTMGVTNKSPEFLAKFPDGRVPALETPSGFCLSQGGAIAQYVAESGPKAGQLLGTTPETRAKITQWQLFVETDLAGSGASVPIGMIMGRIPYNQGMYDTALAAFERDLAIADKAVAGKKFLVGEQLTIADVSLVSALGNVMSFTLDAEMRGKVPALMTYFEEILKVPEVAKVITTVNKVETRKRPAAA